MLDEDKEMVIKDKNILDKHINFLNGDMDILDEMALWQADELQMLDRENDIPNKDIIFLTYFQFFLNGHYYLSSNDS